MSPEEFENLFIKHCSNYQRLAAEQLHAIKAQKDDRAVALMQQKQIIMESMVALQEQFDIQDCQEVIKAKVKELLHQIAISEQAGQQLVTERCVQISKTMLANRKELDIQQAYEKQSSFQERGNWCNIEK